MDQRKNKDKEEVDLKSLRKKNMAKLILMNITILTHISVNI